MGSIQSAAENAKAIGNLRRLLNDGKDAAEVLVSNGFSMEFRAMRHGDETTMKFTEQSAN